MKKIVIVDLAGGIGNQIFLFEAASSLAAINNCTVLVNKTNIDRNHSNGQSTIEDYIFPNNVKFFKLSPLVNRVYLQVQKYLRMLNTYNQSLSLVLNEDYSSHGIDEIREMITGRNPRFIIVTGFWQSFAFWNNNFKFELRLESSKFCELLSKIHSENPIIFHYRLGKINNKWEHGWGALGPQYLLNALAALDQDNLNSNIVWIFSNDLTEARKLIESINCASYKFFYVDDSKILPSESILLISSARILICSNSTFSILAAKIGTVEKVIAPLELSKNGDKNIDLPNDWKRIKSIWLD